MNGIRITTGIKATLPNRVDAPRPLMFFTKRHPDVHGLSPCSTASSPCVSLPPIDEYHPRSRHPGNARQDLRYLPHANP